MPRQRIHHSRVTYQVPDDFPERLERFKEESGLPWDVMRRVFRRLRHLPEDIDSPRRKELTSREKEILAQFAKGMSYAAIAESRGNRSSTVRNTIYHIQDKLGFGSKQEIVVWAVRNGLVD